MGEMFIKVAEFQNLLGAFKRAFKGKRKSPEAATFHLNLEYELFKLRADLLNKQYKPGMYRYFKIVDPKERVISEAPFRDRVVHHALVNIIEPIFEKRFIQNSFACRKGKGTHRAVLLAQSMLGYFHLANRTSLLRSIFWTNNE